MSSLSSPAVAVPVGVVRPPRNVVWATVISNGLVVYDFTVYSFAALMIAQRFFPADSALASLSLAMLTFGVGFVVRPLGALLIGGLADRRGRKAGLLLSNLLMVVGTGIIAFAPTFDTIGVAATLLIVLARLLQGLAVGGETGVASVVLMELAPRAHRCYLVSWRSASQAGAALAGALVGAALSALLSTEQLYDWGWRVPFMLGLLIAPVGWYLRRHMVEVAAPARRRVSLRRVIEQQGPALWLGVLLMAAPASSIYLLVYYMPTYLVNTLQMPATLGLLSACVSAVLVLVAAPLFARLADRQRSRKRLQGLTSVLSIVLVYPLFLALTQGCGELMSLLIIGVFSVLVMGNNGAVTVLIMEAFARHHRATGMTMVYSLGSTLFGGFCPFIVTWLIHVTGDAMAPAWYLLAALSISLYALVRFPAAFEPDEAADKALPGARPGSACTPA